MLQATSLQALIDHLALQLRLSISQVSSVSGGDINEAIRIDTNKGAYFVKYNTASQAYAMLEAESKALKQIATTNIIATPAVACLGQYQEQAYLVLEYIESGQIAQDTWRTFGRQLAQLHQVSSPYFGDESHNFIGSLPQDNTQEKDWTGFFENRRIRPQLELAVKQGYFSPTEEQKFNRFFDNVQGVFPLEPASLLHGDLWGGNYLIDQNGVPYLIDPATYFGHREMDLGMTCLFGGFAPDFYAAYHETYPLMHGFTERRDLSQLYYLLVHLNLFGRSYLSRVRSIIRHYT